MTSLRTNILWAVPILLSLGCTRSARVDFAPERSSKVPVAVLVEKVIEGTILKKELQSPAGMAVGGHGFLYLVDAGNNRLIRFNDELVAEDDIGGMGNDPGLFNYPGFVAVDNNLNFFVCDAGNRRISRHNSRLQYVDEISLRDEEDLLKFGEPSGIAVTEFGEVWISDLSNDRIMIFNHIGQFDRFIGGFGYRGGELRSPAKIMQDESESFYVCDPGNSRIVVYDRYGSYDGEISVVELGYPHSLAFDNFSMLWAVDSRSGSLFCLGADLQAASSFGPSLAGNDQPLKEPYDIAFMPDGRLLISDSGNHRLVVCRVIYANR